MSSPERNVPSAREYSPGGGSASSSTNQAKSASARENSKDSTAQGNMKRGSVERSVEGLTYHVDETHWMCTFVWDRDGQERKMLRYDLEKLVRVGGVLSMLCSGTVFTMDSQLAKATLVYLIVLTSVAVGLSLGLDSESLVNYDTESLEQLSDHINGFVPFVLALYVSLVLSRWWALRVQALGNLFNASSNTVMIVSICLPTEKWSKLRKQVVRLCMASIMLVVKAARQDEDLSSLIEQKLIDESEAQVLYQAQPFQRSTTMWIWILRLCETAFTLEKVPPPRFNALMAKAVQARDGVQTIHTYLDTQLPFAYVHLITLLVNIQNLVVAFKCGVVFAVAYETQDVQRMVNQVIMATLVCVIYQGLLVISYVVHDPFGEDLLDFPVVAYTEYVAHSCAAVETASQNCPVLAPKTMADLLGVDESTAKDILTSEKKDPAGKSKSKKGEKKLDKKGRDDPGSRTGLKVASGDPQRLKTAISKLATELQVAKGTEAAEDLVRELQKQQDSQQPKTSQKKVMLPDTNQGRQWLNHIAQKKALPVNPCSGDISEAPTAKAGDMAAGASSTLPEHDPNYSPTMGDLKQSEKDGPDQSDDEEEDGSSSDDHEEDDEVGEDDPGGFL